MTLDRRRKGLYAFIHHGQRFQQVKSDDGRDDAGIEHAGLGGKAEAVIKTDRLKSDLAQGFAGGNLFAADPFGRIGKVLQRGCEPNVAAQVGQIQRQVPYGRRKPGKRFVVSLRRPVNVSDRFADLGGIAQMG